MQEKLNGLKDIEFSDHAEKALEVRQFKKDEIKGIIKGSKRLLSSEHQEDPLPGDKYRLVFGYTNRYNLVVVMNFIEDKAKVVTFHKENIKKMEKVRKWLEKHR